MCTIKQTKLHKYVYIILLFDAPWVNFLHQNIFERLAYFGPIFFLLLFVKGPAFGILEVTISMKVRFLNSHIYNIHGLWFETEACYWWAQTFKFSKFQTFISLTFIWAFLKNNGLYHSNYVSFISYIHKNL